MSLENDREQRMDRLFAEYRAVSPDIDAGADFMPSLWRRIEARRNPVFAWVTMSRRVLAGAFALCLLFGFFLNSGITANLFYQSTYIEALAEEEEPEDLALLRPAGYFRSWDNE